MLRSAEVLTVATSVEVRLGPSPGGGGVGLETVAVFEIVPATDEATATVRVSPGAAVLAARGPGSAQVISWGAAPVAEQFQAGVTPPAEANETKDSPTGSWSVTVKGPAASEGPRFVTESA